MRAYVTESVHFIILFDYLISSSNSSGLLVPNIVVQFSRVRRWPDQTKRRQHEMETRHYQTMTDACSHKRQYLLLRVC